MQVKTIVVGGGAAGLMCAAHLPKGTAILLEANMKVGNKIRISGGGRCNITNRHLSPVCYRADARYITYALERFDNELLLLWLGERGVEPILRKGDQYFCKESSDEIVRALQAAASKQQIVTNTKVLGATKEKGYFCVETNKGQFRCENLIVASGGVSYPRLGASDIGYQIAKSFGHSVIAPKPALVGLTLQPRSQFSTTLSGISTEVQLRVGEKTLKGSLLFAHKGITGPVTLNASLFWDKGNITANWLYGKDGIDALAKRLAKALLLQLTRFDAHQSLDAFTIYPSGTFGFSRAEVTKGGVATDELDAYTMQSKLCQGLYFIGEVVDVTGMLGGYNFQWAFSSAVVCADALQN